MTSADVPICRIIAGPNGAGKTTFALTYLRLIHRMRSLGWRVELIYLALPSLELSILRVAERVAHGGHDVPEGVLRRRFPRSLQLLLNAYAPAVDHMLCNLNAGPVPAPVFFQSGAERTILDPQLYAHLLELAP